MAFASSRLKPSNSFPERRSPPWVSDSLADAAGYMVGVAPPTFQKSSRFHVTIRRKAHFLRCPLGGIATGDPQRRPHVTRTASERHQHQASPALKRGGRFTRGMDHAETNATTDSGGGTRSGGRCGSASEHDFGRATSRGSECSGVLLHGYRSGSSGVSGRSV